MLNKNAQSILEYTLLLAVVIAVLVLVLVGNGTDNIKQKITNAYNNTGDALESTSNQLTSDIFITQ